MKGKLVGGVLRFAGGKMGGKKPYVAGAGMILAGLAGLIGYMLPDEGIPVMDVDTALTLIATGGALIAGKKVANVKAAAAAAK
jgi:hypothetical protein